MNHNVNLLKDKEQSSRTAVNFCTKDLPLEYEKKQSRRSCSAKTGSELYVCPDCISTVLNPDSQKIINTATDSEHGSVLAGWGLRPNRGFKNTEVAATEINSSFSWQKVKKNRFYLRFPRSYAVTCYPVWQINAGKLIKQTKSVKFSATTDCWLPASASSSAKVDKMIFNNVSRWFRTWVCAAEVFNSTFIWGTSNCLLCYKGYRIWLPSRYENKKIRRSVKREKSKRWGRTHDEGLRHLFWDLEQWGLLPFLIVSSWHSACEVVWPWFLFSKCRKWR